MHFRCKLELRCQLDSVKILFWLGVGGWVGVGGKIIPRIILTSAKDLVEVEAELGNKTDHYPLQKLPELKISKIHV